MTLTSWTNISKFCSNGIILRDSKVPTLISFSTFHLSFSTAMLTSSHDWCEWQISCGVVLVYHATGLLLPARTLPFLPQSTRSHYRSFAWSMAGMPDRMLSAKICI